LKDVVAEGPFKMAWLVCFVAVALVAALGIVVNLNRIGFERRLEREMRRLLAVPSSAVPQPGIAVLPPPVARYHQGMTAKRFNDKGKLLPWGGIYRDWRTVSGMRVPFEAEVSWQLDTGPFTYAHWFVDSMDYDDALAPGCN